MHDAIFSLKLLIDKRMEYNKETYLTLIDFEEVFDNVNRVLR